MSTSARLKRAKMPWGMYKGRDLDTIPSTYLSHLLDKYDLSPYKGLRETMERAVREDGGQGTSVSEVVRRWHRSLAKRYDEDKDALEIVDEAYSLLRDMLGLEDTP
jgi:uncharacterized protein (DUF3820 family)